MSAVAGATQQKIPPPEQRACQFLCGLPPEALIGEREMPDGFTRESLELWVQRLLPLLPSAWQTLPAEAFRQQFLQRPGWLHSGEGKCHLRLCPAESDSLLSDWLWPVNAVSLPWLTASLTITWTDN
ncbi:contractile injection system tape measure protein [Yokenella regensburgei]|uniref:contractile injection system tape measure protein n=1 Tax=Yokenella regensburgei TaxID=158877 RepID=UPI0031CDFEF5